MITRRRSGSGLCSGLALGLGRQRRLPNPACTSQRTGLSTSPEGWWFTSCCARPRCWDACFSVVVALRAYLDEVEQPDIAVDEPNVVASA